MTAEDKAAASTTTTAAGQAPGFEPAQSRGSRTASPAAGLRASIR